MCINSQLMRPAYEKPFDLEKEMINYFGEEKAKKVLFDISEYYKNLLPLQPESISCAGLNRFDKHGDLVTEFKLTDKLFSYLITFRKRSNSKGVEIDATYIYTFN